MCAQSLSVGGHGSAGGTGLFQVQEEIHQIFIQPNRDARLAERLRLQRGQSGLACLDSSRNAASSVLLPPLLYVHIVHCEFFAEKRATCKITFKPYYVRARL